jgi:hypothetical protein
MHQLNLNTEKKKTATYINICKAIYFYHHQTGKKVTHLFHCLFHTVLVTLLFVFLVVFLSTVSFFSLPKVLILWFPPSPLSPIPFPCSFYLVGHFLFWFSCRLLLFLLMYYFSEKPVRVLPFALSCFVWDPPGMLTAGPWCLVVWGFRSLNAAFLWWSCLSYSIIIMINDIYLKHYASHWKAFSSLTLKE